MDDLTKMSVEQLRELGGCLVLPAAFEELARRYTAAEAEIASMKQGRSGVFCYRCGELQDRDLCDVCFAYEKSGREAAEAASIPTNKTGTPDESQSIADWDHDRQYEASRQPAPKGGRDE